MSPRQILSIILRLEPALILPAMLCALVSLGCRPASDRETRSEVKADSRSSEFIAHASAASRSGNFGQALVLADSVILRQPDLADGFFLKARIYYELGDYDRADSLFSVVTRMSSSYPGVLHNRANIDFKRGNYRNAVSGYFQEARELGEARSWHGLGGAYDKLGVPDSAEWAFNRALNADSLYYPALISLAMLFERDGNPGSALLYARRAHRLDSVSLGLKHRLSRLETLAGDPERSIPILREVIASEPWNYSALFDLANAFRKLGREDRAREFYAKSDSVRRAMGPVELLERNVIAYPTDFNARIQLADAYRKQGRIAEALTNYQVALAKRPRNLDLRSNIATLQLQNGREDTAAAMYEAILAEAPDHIPTLLNMAVLSLQRNDSRSLQDYIARVQKLDPDHPALERLRQAAKQ